MRAGDEMAVTGEEVFKITMMLMDEVTDQGTINASDTQYYKGKTPSILTTLQAELLSNGETPTIISDLGQPLNLPDKVCLSVLPNGLAAHLLLTEDANIASFFNGRYEELRRKAPTTIQPIEDKLDVLQGMR